MPSFTALASFRFNPVALNQVGIVVDGTWGDDVLYGSTRADSLYGDYGDDYLSAGRGNDLLDGGWDDDVLDGGAGADSLIGGMGRDTASYRSASAGVMVDLANGGITNDAAGDTYSGIEDVWGSAYDDIINGDNGANLLAGSYGNDFLFGQGGDDWIYGGRGDDTIRGGEGSDRLLGGQGSDRLTGGADVDIFIFGHGEGLDIVTDFESGVDAISLEGGRGFGTDNHLASGDTRSAELWDRVRADGDRTVWDPGTSTLYAVIWSGSDEQQHIEGFTPIVVLQGVTELAESDFVARGMFPPTDIVI